MAPIEIDLGKFFFTDPEDTDAMYNAMMICLPPYLARWNVPDVFMAILSGETKQYKAGELHIIPAGKAVLWDPAYIVPVFEALYSHQYSVLAAPYTWNIYPCNETQNIYLRQHSIDERTKREYIRSMPLPKPKGQKKRSCVIKNISNYMQEPHNNPNL